MIRGNLLSPETFFFSSSFILQRSAKTPYLSSTHETNLHCLLTENILQCGVRRKGERRMSQSKERCSLFLYLKERTVSAERKLLKLRSTICSMYPRYT